MSEKLPLGEFIRWIFSHKDPIPSEVDDTAFIEEIMQRAEETVVRLKIAENVAQPRSTTDEIGQVQGTATNQQSNPRGKNQGNPKPTEDDESIALAELRKLPVSHIMNPKPVILHPATTLAEATIKMDRFRFEHMPIVDEEQQFMGIISKYDLHDALDAHPQRMNGVFADRQVSSIMSQGSLVIQADAPVYAAMKLMTTSPAQFLPVLDGKHLIGVVTPTDVVNAIANVR